jgi:membrane protein YdbS with pleckstrin-like domain
MPAAPGQKAVMRKVLLPGEQVIVVTRPQPRMLVVPGLFFVIVPALAAYACAWVVKGGPAKFVPIVPTDWTPWLVAGCLAVAAWVLLGYCLPRVMAWHATRYILTSQRLVTRYGMLRRRDQQVLLAAVRHVAIEQSLLQRLLRSGNISLETGYPPATVVRDVPEVAIFRNFMLDAIGDLPTGETNAADGMTYNPGEAMPWETREGGRDER